MGVQDGHVRQLNDGIDCSLQRGNDGTQERVDGITTALDRDPSTSRSGHTFRLACGLTASYVEFARERHLRGQAELTRGHSVLPVRERGAWVKDMTVGGAVRGVCSRERPR